MPAASSPSVWSNSRPRDGAGLALAMLLTGAAYLPGALGPRDLVYWDDTLYIRNNPQMEDLDGLRRIWFTFESDQYYPLTFSTFWLEVRLWGDWTTGFYLTNVALHLVNVALLYRLARTLGASPAAAFLAAALFGVHPLQVSSVAWVAQRKNTLSTALGLLSVLLLVRWLRGEAGDAGRRRWHFAAVACFAAAALSKTAVATLPISAMLAGRAARPTGDAEAPPAGSRRRELAVVIPMLAVAAVLSAITHMVETPGPAADLALESRVLVAAAAVWFYLAKLAWPADLQAIYPQWNRAATNAALWAALAGLVPLAALLVVAARRLGRTFSWGLLHFAVCLAPILGLVRFDYLRLTPVADHFLYLPLAGAFVSVSVAADRWVPRRGRAAAGAVALLVVAALAWVSAVQTEQWRNGEALWTRTLERNPDCAVAHNNLALLRARDEPGSPEVVEGFRRAVACDPAFTLARINLGQALERAGRVEEALAVFGEAAARDPRDATAQFNLGLALWRAGHRDEALACYRHAIQLRRDYFQAWTNLGTAFLELGQTGDAVKALQTARMLRPSDAATRIGLGQALLAAADLEQALVEFRAAQKLAPRLAAAPMNIGLTLLRRGDVRGALDALRAAVSVDPRDPAAVLNLGALLAQVGQLDAAEPCFRTALELDPRNPQIRANLGALLIQRGQFAAAIEHLTSALSLDPDYVNAVFHLGRAHAGLRQWSDAVDCFRRVTHAAPQDAEAHYQLGLALEQSGAAQDAAEAFEAAIRLQPERDEYRAARQRCASQPASAP